MRLQMLLMCIVLVGCNAPSVAPVPVEIIKSGSPKELALLGGGSRPSWQVVIDRARITLTYDREGKGGPGSIKSYVFPLVQPQAADGVRTWVSSANGLQITVESKATPCGDGDLRFPETVRVTANGKTLDGCAGEPRPR